MREAITRIVSTICLLTAAAICGAGEMPSVDRLPLVPCPIDWDSPEPQLVDFSGLLEAPAGAKGFIRVEGGRLVKPSGSRFRIWGVNITAGFCFPSHEQSEAMAEDLARLGINCVRFHGLDSNWGRSSIDQNRNDTQHMDEESLELFDYLVWQLKKRGIYTNLNLNVFRKYKIGDGVRDFGPLYFGKSATYFNPRLLELQRDYARKLLTHRNQHTGNEYRYEPAVACIELVNENSVLEGWVNGRLVGRDEEHPGTWSPIPVSYAQELNRQLNGWLQSTYPPSKLAAWREEAGVAVDAPLPCLKPDQFQAVSRERFHAEAEFYFVLEKRFFAEMRKLLKDELGIKSLVVGTADHNDTICGYPHIEANIELDFIDGHGYWQHPQIGDVTRITNTPMVNDPWDSTIIQFARTPVQGLPYTISETNHPFPHEYACEGIPSLTAYAMLNDWDGIYWFCYDRGAMHKAKDYPPRTWFDMSVDPVKVTQIAACAPMWHRQDIATAKKVVLRSYTHDQAIELLRGEKWKMRPFYSPEFAKTTPLVHSTQFTLDGSPASPFPQETSPNAIESDTGELGWYDARLKRGIITVDTPCTQALIGFVGGSERTITHFSADLRNAFCALQLSSLDDQPIARSARMLLTTTALATNAGIQWKEDHQTLEAWGDGPSVIEPVTGEITLTRLSSDATQLRVTPLTVTGRRLGEPSVVPIAAGSATVRVGHPPCTWYLVELSR